MVTLMTQSYFEEKIKQFIPEPQPGGINAHNLFNLKGVGGQPSTIMQVLHLQLWNREEWLSLMWVFWLKQKNNFPQARVSKPNYP